MKKVDYLFNNPLNRIIAMQMVLWLNKLHVTDCKNAESS